MIRNLSHDERQFRTSACRGSRVIRIIQTSSDITPSDTLFSPDWKSYKKKLERGNGKIINGRASEGGEVRAREGASFGFVARPGSKPNKLASPCARARAQGRAAEI